MSETVQINLETTKKAVVKLNGVKIYLTSGNNGIQIRGDAKFVVVPENDRTVEIIEAPKK